MYTSKPDPQYTAKELEAKHKFKKNEIKIRPHTLFSFPCPHPTPSKMHKFERLKDIDP